MMSIITQTKVRLMTIMVGMIMATALAKLRKKMVMMVMAIQIHYLEGRYAYPGCHACYAAW